MPMGMADAATALFTRHLKFDPSDPHWPDRDRFVLSAGHGSMLIYALLYLTGYARPTIDDIKRFRQLGSPCAGHPENFQLDGVEVDHRAAGARRGDGGRHGDRRAAFERRFRRRPGRSPHLRDRRRRRLMEGVNHEAVGLAGHLELGRLIVLWDDNRITIDGSTDLSRSEDVIARLPGRRLARLECDGLDAGEVERALEAAIAEPRPSLIRCRTIIGYGAPNKQGTAATHGAALGADEVAAARNELGWDQPPFEIPDDVLRPGASAGSAAPSSAQWRERLQASGRKRRIPRADRGRRTKAG